MEVDDDKEDDDMDFNPLLTEGSPSETSSGLTSEAECEGASLKNQPSTEVYLRDSPCNKNTCGSALPQKRIPAKVMCEEKVPESTSPQLCRENGEGHVNGLGKEPLQTEASFSPSVPNSHPLLVEPREDDAISGRTRARCSVANYALDELETFLQESDDDGNLQNADEEEEYRKFLATVLSGGGDDTQACPGEGTQDEDENDADFELEIVETLKRGGDENVEHKNDRNGKDAHRPKTRKKRAKLSRAAKRQESSKSDLRPILPNRSAALLAPGNASQDINVPSSSSSVEGFTDEQLGRLHMLIYEHVQLMIQTFSLSVLDPSKQRVAADVKKMMIELVGCRDQALAARNTIHRPFCFERQHLQSVLSHESSQFQWIPSIRNPVMSIIDVLPLHLAPSYLSDVAAVVVKHRKSLVDGTAEKIRSTKEPLFPSRTGKDANNVSQDRSNSVSTASPASPGQLHPKKTRAVTLFDSTKMETVALVPLDIARLAQRFYPYFNCLLFPRKPPSAAMVQRVLFTDAEDGLLALGILEYNNDWEAMQKRFLPCKSTHQIFVRQKNRSSINAPDNPVKEVRRMKTSPLSTEEIQRIEEGLKILKNDWTSIWKVLLPYRDPGQLQRQWRVATGVQRSYCKSDDFNEKRRGYEAKRRKLKASRVDRGQEADNDASEGVENDDDWYVNEACLADTGNKSMNMMHIGTHGIVDGPSTKRVFGGTFDELQVSQLGTEKGSHVVKLAPDLPLVNLPPSVRVMSQMEFHQNTEHFNGTSDNAANDLFPVPPPTFTECVYTQLNHFPDCSNSDRSQQHGICNGSAIEDGVEQDFPMHPLLLSHPSENHHSRNYDLFPFEKVQVEKSNKQTTDGMEGAPVNANTVDFHPLLQRAEVYGEVPEKDCHQFAKSGSQPEGSMKDRASILNLEPGNAFSHHDIEELIEEALQGVVMEQEELSDSMKDRASISNLEPGNAFSQHDIEKIIEEAMQGIVMEQEELSDSMKDRASISNLELGNAFSHHDIEEIIEEAMQGIVMEQEELNDSEEDVVFECEEIDDSDEEQVHDAEPCLTGNKGTAKSVVCSEFSEGYDLCQIEQGLEQVVKQGASSRHKSRGSSSTRPGRAKLKPEPAKPTGTRRSLRLATSRAS